MPCQVAVNHEFDCYARFGHKVEEHKVNPQDEQERNVATVVDMRYRTQEVQ